jgi:hypothetical protein
MIPDLAHLSQVAQLEAARQAESASMNADRLDAWQRRYPYDVVEVPLPTEPPKWPALRSSIAVDPANVTPIRKARAK